MPRNPPMVLPINEAYIESAPSSIGAYPPAVDAITIAIIIKLFFDMVSTLAITSYNHYLYMSYKTVVFVCQYNIDHKKTKIGVHIYRRV